MKLLVCAMETSSNIHLKELKIREKITKNPYDLSPIIVLDEIIDEKYEIEINATTYEDVKEEII